MVYLALLLAALLGYLLGSISFAVLIAKRAGVDIFTVGSGNPGATNVLRNLGKGPGYTCFVLDALKGVAAVLVGYGVAGLVGTPEAALFPILALVGAIVGHSFSIFLGFKGGKGVATTIGGLLVLMPAVMGLGLAVWLLVFFTTRYVSLASILLGLSLPLSAWLLDAGAARLILALLLAVTITVRHHANIRRLLQGTENRAGKK